MTWLLVANAILIAVNLVFAARRQRTDNALANARKGVMQSVSNKIEMEMTGELSYTCMCGLRNTITISGGKTLNGDAKPVYEDEHEPHSG